MRPQVGHFIGQEVTEVDPHDDNGPRITLVSDSSIYKGDPVTGDLVGMTLVAMDFREQVTELLFQKMENNQPMEGTEIYVNLEPTNYLIETPENDPFNPSEPDPEAAEETLPPDPSPERITDGPPEVPGSDSEPLEAEEGDKPQVEGSDEGEGQS